MHGCPDAYILTNLTISNISFLYRWTSVSIPNVPFKFKYYKLTVCLHLNAIFNTYTCRCIRQRSRGCNARVTLEFNYRIRSSNLKHHPACFDKCKTIILSVWIFPIQYNLYLILGPQNSVFKPVQSRFRENCRNSFISNPNANFSVHWDKGVYETFGSDCPISDKLSHFPVSIWYFGTK